MAQRCIGIDIGPEHIRAVQVARIAGKFHIERTFSGSLRRTNDSPDRALRSLFDRGGFHRRAAAAIALAPQDTFFGLWADSDNAAPTQYGADNGNSEFKQYKTGSDSSALKQYETGSNSPALTQYTIDEIGRDNFPQTDGEIIAETCPTFQSDNIGLGHMSEYESGPIITASDCTAIDRRLSSLNKAKIRCALLDAPIFAVQAGLNVNHPELADTTVIIGCFLPNYTALGISRNGRIIIARNLPIGSASQNDNRPDPDETAALLREIELTWLSAFCQKVPGNTSFVCAGRADTGLLSEIENRLDCRIMTADPCANVQCLADEEPGRESYLAQALAIRSLSRDESTGVNLLRRRRRQAHRQDNPARQLSLALCLIVIIGAMLLSGILIRRVRLEKENAVLEQTMHAVFTEALPHEKNIVNELAQLETQLQALENDYQLIEPGSGVDPLGLWQLIETATPTELALVVEDMLITAETIRLTASCDSFDTPYRWQKLLQQIGQFSRVEVRQPYSPAGTRRVHFTMQITLG